MDRIDVPGLAEITRINCALPNKFWRSKSKLLAIFSIKFFVGGMYFFLTGQAQRFHVLILIDLHDFVNGKIKRLFMPEQLLKFNNPESYFHNSRIMSI